MNTNFNVAEVALSYKNSVPYNQRTKITGAKDAYRILRKLHDMPHSHFLRTLSCIE